MGSGFSIYQNWMGKLSFALFLAMLIALPLPRMILQPIAVAWIISWVLEGRFLQRANWRWTPLALPGLLLVVLTLWEAVSLLWCPDVSAGLRMIERHWPLVVLVVVPIFGLNANYRAEKVLPTLFAACVASVPLYLFTYYWVWNFDAVIWFRPDLIRPFEFPSFHGITSLMKLRSYYCIILMLAIFSTPYLYRQYRARYSRAEVVLTLGVADAVLIAGMLMTGSRSAILIFAVTTVFLMFVSYRRRLKWWWQVLVVVLGLSAGVASVVLSPRFYTFANVDFSELDLTDSDATREPRFYIWSAVMEHVGDYGLFGLGAGGHVPFLQEQYRQAGALMFLEQGFGPHSQYLSAWMCLGPMAVLLLLAAFVLIPRVYKGNGHFAAHALAFLFAFSMLADDLLERMDSILILLIGMVVIYVLETSATATNKSSSATNYHS